jgi:hypothetical protein
MKFIASLIIFGILLSYVPSFSTEDCKEVGHSNRINLDCGNLFHCPFILEHGIPENFYLPLKGRMALVNQFPNLKMIPHPIFHPPKIQEIQ